MTFLCRWLLSSVDGNYPFWVVNWLWVVFPLLGLKMVYLKQVGDHPKRAVTIHIWQSLT